MKYPFPKSLSQAANKPQAKFRWQKLRLIEIRDDGTEMWRNKIYMVMVFRSGKVQHKSSRLGGGLSVNIIPLDGSPRHDWREYQEIKNQVAGKEWEAIELYPAESRLVDCSNTYNLLCFPKVSLGKYIGRKIQRGKQSGWPQRK